MPEVRQAAQAASHVREVELVATIEDQDVPEVVEHTMQPGASSITLNAVEPDLDPQKARLAAERGGRPIPADVDATA